MKGYIIFEIYFFSLCCYYSYKLGYIIILGGETVEDFFINGIGYDVEVEEVKLESAFPQTVKDAALVVPITPQVFKAPEPKVEVAVPAGASTIKSPMPGTILKVNVSASDSVKKGQVLGVELPLMIVFKWGSMGKIEKNK